VPVFPSRALSAKHGRVSTARNKLTSIVEGEKDDSEAAIRHGTEYAADRRQEQVCDQGKGNNWPAPANPAPETLILRIQEIDSCSAIRFQVDIFSPSPGQDRVARSNGI